MGKTQDKAASNDKVKKATARTKGLKRGHPLPPAIQIIESPIAGYGVIALEPIKKGTKVLEYTGDRITDEEADEMFGKDIVRLFDLGNGMVIDGDVHAMAVYINHSCDPNCFTEIENDRVWIRAKRKIKAGEELTYDYQFEADMEDSPCNCGAKHCRGMINLPGG